MFVGLDNDASDGKLVDDDIVTRAGGFDAFGVAFPFLAVVFSFLLGPPVQFGMNFTIGEMAL